MKKLEKNQEGFSFVELMAVIIILSALSFFVLPNFTAPKPSGDHSKTGNHEALADLMTELKAKAVKEKKDHLLHIDQTSGRIWITDGEKKGKTRDFYFPVTGAERLRWTEPALTDTKITFFRQGYSEAALIRLKEMKTMVLKSHSNFIRS